MIKTLNHHTSCIQMQTCCMDGQCLKYFLYVVLNEKKTVSKFDEGFIKNYGEDSNKGYIIDVDIEYPKNVLNLYRNLPFLP